jgi:transcriptional regulator with XRE-family HTH domain
VIARDRWYKFESKDYRDAYMASRVRASIALQIRALREQRRLSQTDFANRLGKPQSVLSRLENTEYGRVTVQTLLEIASALDVALVVKFCTYRDFFNQMSDTSDRALSVESFSSRQLEPATVASLGESAPSGQEEEGPRASPQVSLSDALVSQVTGPPLSQSSRGKAPGISRAQKLPSILDYTASSGMRAAA